MSSPNQSPIFKNLGLAQVEKNTRFELGEQVWPAERTFVFRGTGDWEFSSQRTLSPSSRFQFSEQISSPAEMLVFGASEEAAAPDNGPPSDKLNVGEQAGCADVLSMSCAAVYFLVLLVDTYV